MLWALLFRCSVGAWKAGHELGEGSLQGCPHSSGFNPSYQSAVLSSPRALILAVAVGSLSLSVWQAFSGADLRSRSSAVAGMAQHGYAHGD